MDILEERKCVRNSELSWDPFPQNLDKMLGKLTKIYKGFKALKMDQAYIKAKQEEKLHQAQKKSKADWQTVEYRAHRRAYVEMARSILENIPFDRHDSFWLVDLSRVAYKMRHWCHVMPYAKPYYAVKCNTNSGILHVLVSLESGFDCASREEMHSVVQTMALAKKHHKTSLNDMPNVREIPDVDESKPSFSGFWTDDDDDDKNNKTLADEYLKDPEFRKEVAERILFTHSIKEPSHIQYARKIGVKMTVADNEQELYKLKQFWPDADVILRITSDDRQSCSAFSTKFGATKKQLRHVLIPLAKKLGLRCVGVSFHAGSDSVDPSAWDKAISDSRKVFDYTRDICGYDMKILDIGGGFPGSAAWKVRFEVFAAQVRKSINRHFFADGTFKKDQLLILGEPGRFMVSESHALVTTIVGARETRQPDIKDSEDEEEANEYQTKIVEELDRYQYFINDGNYAGLNVYRRDEATPKNMHVHSLRLPNTGLLHNLHSDENHASKDELQNKDSEKKQKNGIKGPKKDKSKQIKDSEAEYHKEELIESTIFGQTCDSTDAPAKGALLPRLEVGDALVFTHSGAYTTASASHFNGFSSDRLVYVYLTDSACPDVLNFHPAPARSVQG